MTGSMFVKICVYFRQTWLIPYWVTSTCPIGQCFFLLFVLYACVGEWQRWTESSLMCRCIFMYMNTLLIAFRCCFTNWSFGLSETHAEVGFVQLNSNQVCQILAERSSDHTTLNLYRTLRNYTTWKTLKWFCPPTTFTKQRGIFQARVHSLADKALVLDLQQAWDEVLNNTNWLLRKPLYLLPTTSTIQGFRSSSLLKKIWCLNLFSSRRQLCASCTGCRMLINSFCSNAQVIVWFLKWDSQESSVMDSCHLLLLSLWISYKRQ